jgi:hypothetical protein
MCLVQLGPLSQQGRGAFITYLSSTHICQMQEHLMWSMLVSPPVTAPMDPHCGASPESEFLEPTNHQTPHLLQQQVMCCCLSLQLLDVQLSLLDLLSACTPTGSTDCGWPRSSQNQEPQPVCCYIPLTSVRVATWPDASLASLTATASCAVTFARSWAGEGDTELQAGVDLNPGATATGPVP